MAGPRPQSLQESLPFDPVKDFTPVATLASLPFRAHRRCQEADPFGRRPDCAPQGAGRRDSTAASNNTGIVAAELFQGRDRDRCQARGPTRNIADSVNDMIAGPQPTSPSPTPPGVVEQAKGRPHPRAGGDVDPAVDRAPRTCRPWRRRGFPGIELTPWWGGVSCRRGARRSPSSDKLASSFDRILAMPETTEFPHQVSPTRPFSRHGRISCGTSWRGEILRWGETDQAREDRAAVSCSHRLQVGIRASCRASSSA